MRQGHGHPWLIALIVILCGMSGRDVRGQLALADDIIIASQGGEAGGERGIRLEVPQGSRSGARFRNEPDSPTILLGHGDVPVPEAITRPDLPDPVSDPSQDVPLQAPERQRIAIHFPQEMSISPPEEMSHSQGSTFGDMELPTSEGDLGPPNGLTLDQAIERLVRCSLILQTQYYAIPIAEADILTAGLRKNPLFFYDTSGVPYGAYSEQRPGEIDHGLSLVFPIDYTHKRRAREEVSRQAKRVLQAEYQDAVRKEIDQLYTAFVDTLAAKESVRYAESAVNRLGTILDAARKKQAPRDELDSLLIEREMASMLVDTERDRLQKAKYELAGLLNMPPEQANVLEIRGTIRDEALPAPPTDQLIAHRLAEPPRPDRASAGHRPGVEGCRSGQGETVLGRVPALYAVVVSG